jgi:sorting nexin-29
MEKCYENKIDLYMLFIDFRQAFDTIKWKKLIRTLEKFDIPKKLIKMIAITLEDSRSKVFVGGKLSEPFMMSSGVRSSDSISAVLFNLALHEAIKDMRIRGTVMYKSKNALHMLTIWYWWPAICKH